MTDQRDWFDDLRAVRDCVAAPEVKHLLLVLVTYVRQDSCWPSVETLARGMGVDARTVQRRMKAAVDAGFVRRDPRFTLNGQTSNRLTLDFAAIDATLGDRGGDADVTGGGDAHVTGGVTPTSPRTTSRTTKKKEGVGITTEVSWSPEHGFSGAGLQALIAAAKKAAPKLDVDAEVEKAHGWLVANPGNAKRLFGRFLWGWLMRSMDGTRSTNNGVGRTDTTRSARAKSGWDCDDAAPDVAVLRIHQMEDGQGRLYKEAP